MQSMKTPGAIIVLLGPTGTGKSSFINLLTNDENIHIGHTLESQTIDVKTSCYFDTKTGLSVTLVDTPGFDDSRDGVTDTDILGKIATFLQEDGGRKINGIIYLHRISDPRMGGQAKKNLRVFKELCGDNNLENVRIATTYWNRVEDKMGNDRDAALANGVFKSFIEAGAKLRRHNKELKSAQSIISELIQKTPVMLKIQEELNAGRALAGTSAGAVIIEEMKELQRKHEMDMEDLRKEIEVATSENNEGLKAEVAEERRKLEQMMARAAEDRKRLETTRMARRSDAKKKDTMDEGLGVDRTTTTMSKKGKQPEQVNAQASRSQKWTTAVRPETTQQGNSTKSVETTTATAENTPLLDEERRARPRRQSQRQRQRVDDGTEDWLFSDFLRDAADIILEYSRLGREHLGTLGVIVGVMIGLVVVHGVVFWVVVCMFLSLAMATKKAIFGR